tara:strand:- start:5692 stop:5793 length:102 start_codon:yes stop_codon:yes gene_type:complete
LQRRERQAVAEHLFDGKDKEDLHGKLTAVETIW